MGCAVLAAFSCIQQTGSERVEVHAGRGYKKMSSVQVVSEGRSVGEVHVRSEENVKTSLVPVTVLILPSSNLVPPRGYNEYPTHRPRRR
eukprot:2047921-Rhodomonas_salina.1